MKKMKKILAMLMALTMVLGMTMTASAETETETKVPSVRDIKSVEVQNVEAKFSEGRNTVNVTAYQVIAAKYNDYGFLGYVDVVDLDATKSDLELVADTYMVESERLTSDQVTEIAKDIINGEVDLTSKPLSTTATADGLATYTADLEAGYWIVLVSGTVDEVYNPMLIGVYYDKDTTTGSNGILTPGTVDANTNWTLTTDGAYAKSTAPDLNKSIVDKDGKLNTDGNDNGQSVAYGDTVYFKLDEMKVPSYSKEYTEVTVKITDTLSEGLTLKPSSIAITVGGATLATEDYTITTSSQGFEIQLDSGYVLEVDEETNLPVNAGKDIVVKYEATVDNDAPFNYDENSNTAKFIYSNDPTNETEPKELQDKTYVYTFAIDAKLDGENSEVTEELFKVAVDENGNVVYNCETTDHVVKNPLPGATFRLTNKVTNKAYDATSDNNGMLIFKGLDAGEYTLVETAAPEGYSINAEIHTVKIIADYNDNGTLKYYSIVIDGKNTSTYTATYSADTKTISSSVIPTEIKNTKLINLPSTGGIGTTIFTVAGCGIMIAAAFFFFASRKKENE